MEQFNPALENLVYLGNNYLRAFHGECPVSGAQAPRRSASPTCFSPLSPSPSSLQPSRDVGLSLSPMHLTCSAAAREATPSPSCAVSAPRSQSTPPVP